MDQRADIGRLSSQQFQREGFDFGAIGKLAGAGAGIGSFAGPVGTAIGAGAGAVVGLGASLIKRAREKKAEEAFYRRQQQEILGGINRNNMIDYRRRTAKNLGVSLRDQYNSFY